MQNSHIGPPSWFLETTLNNSKHLNKRCHITLLAFLMWITSLLPIYFKHKELSENFLKKRFHQLLSFTLKLLCILIWSNKVFIFLLPGLSKKGIPTSIPWMQPLTQLYNLLGRQQQLACCTANTFIWNWICGNWHCNLMAETHITTYRLHAGW
jgi:hypothetical protein